MAKLSAKEIIDSLKEMSLLEIKEVVDLMKEEFGVDPSAVAVAEFSKKHPNLEMKVGIVDGKVTLLDELKKLATIPSREGLLTMFASGLMAIPRDFAICLDLHSKNLEEK